MYDFTIRAVVRQANAAFFAQKCRILAQNRRILLSVEPRSTACGRQRRSSGKRCLNSKVGKAFRIPAKLDTKGVDC